LIVFVSSLLLAFQDFSDVNNEKRRNKTLADVNRVFNIIFCIEALLKIAAYGGLGRPTSYFRNKWNCFDFFLVLVGLF